MTWDGRPSICPITIGISNPDWICYSFHEFQCEGVIGQCIEETEPLSIDQIGAGIVEDESVDNNSCVG